MADRKSTRSARAGRSGGHETRTHPGRARRPSRAARPSRSPTSTALPPDLQRTLESAAKRLAIIRAVAVTVEQALRNQNCEQDVEFADCLRWGVSNPVFEQEQLIESMSPPPKAR
jgi:hypothetical protein